MQQTFISRSCGTHDGTFHADEVTACALLVLFNLIDEEKIVRSRDPELLNRCEYVCDVGGLYDPDLKRFDHHQIEYQGDMSSAGMILLYLKQKGLIDEELYQFFNHSLVLGIDAHDNGRTTPEVGVAIFSHVVSNFMPADHEASKKAKSDAFFEAFHFVFGHLKRLFARFVYIKECRKAVMRAMESRGPVLIFERPLQWLESFFDLGGEEHPALFVIMPAEGHWKLRAIPPSYANRMQVRHPLPEEWSGLQGEELKRISGIPGAIFCHKGRFISVWETKEDAMRALEITLRGEL